MSLDHAQGVATKREIPDLWELLDRECLDLIGGALEQPILVTCFPDRWGQEKTEETLSLRQFAAMLKSTRGRNKAALPLFKPATFGDRRTEFKSLPNGRRGGGSLRNDANVQEITGIMVDYDRGEITLDEAARRCRQYDVAALIYSTPSSTPKAPRWRAVLPLSRARSPEEHFGLVARVNGIFGGALDPSSFTLSQAYYGGSVQGGLATEMRLVDGRFLDHAHLLEATAVTKQRDAVPAVTGRASSDYKTGLPFEDFRTLLMVIPNDDSLPENEERNWWLGILASVHHETDGSEEGRQLAHEWSAQWPGYDPAETDRVWDSFRNRPRQAQRTGASILREARKHDPHVLDHRLLAMFTEDDVTGATSPSPVRPAGNLTFLSPRECAVSKRREYVIKGLLAGGDLMCIVGPPGVGKSLFTPHMGYKVVRGEPAFGMRTRQGGVFYVAVEDEHGMRARVAALRARHGDADDFWLVGGVSDLLSDDSSHLEELQRAVAQRRPVLVIIDTLSIAFPGLEENTAEGMGRVVAVARSLTRSGAAVILIHHDTKDGKSGLPRGHSLLNGALDVSLSLSRDQHGFVRGHLTKNRNGTPDRDIAFTIDVHDLGLDEDGDQITTALVKELPSGQVTSKRVHLNKTQRAVLAVLSEMTGTCPDEVPEADLKKRCTDRRDVSASSHYKNRKRAVNRVFAALVEKGEIEVREGRVFRPKQPYPVEDFSDEDFLGECAAEVGQAGTVPG